ncbi:MAG: hypothetical protein KBE09_00620 [Candidatus Pacebacteria bacterium]|nr:hypothetical protein [Candidatus Paceibacterota bacterium]
MDTVLQLEQTLRECLARGDEAAGRQALLDALPNLPEEVRGRLMVTFLEYGLAELDATNTLHNMQEAALKILAELGDQDAAAE